MTKTGKMTQKDLEAVLQMSIFRLEMMGEDITPFYENHFKGIKGANLDKSLGRCEVSYTNTNEVVRTVIKISRHLMKWEYYRKLCDTVMHECIHVITANLLTLKSSSEEAHGGEWLRIANDINKQYAEYNVTRYCDGGLWQDIVNKDAKYRLTFKFKDDEQEYVKHYTRKTNTVKYALNGFPLYVDGDEIEYKIEILR